MKYSLILLSAFLVVACGGLTKAQMGAAYNEAAGKWNPSVDEAEAAYDAALDVATTEDQGLQALKNLYSVYAETELAFIADLRAIAWTPEFVDGSEKLITCINDTYLLELKVQDATELQEAIDSAEAALKKDKSCDAITEDLANSLGLELVNE